VRMKMLVAIVNDRSAEAVMDAAREAGASGATIIQEARGEGRKGLQSLMGLDLEAGRDLMLFIVPRDRSTEILESVARAAEFDETPGTGLVFQVDIEDSLGLRHQYLASVEDSALHEDAS